MTSLVQIFAFFYTCVFLISLDAVHRNDDFQRWELFRNYVIEKSFPFFDKSKVPFKNVVKVDLIVKSFIEFNR